MLLEKVDRVMFATACSPVFSRPPPNPTVLLASNVESVTVRVPKFNTPAPSPRCVEFPETVQRSRVIVASLTMPPPLSAEFPLIVQRVRVAVPSFWMPPAEPGGPSPLEDWLPAMVQSVRVMAPAL